MRTIAAVVALSLPVVTQAQEAPRAALERPAAAAESPRAVIERAVAAHGGMDRLAAARSERLKLTGTILAGTAPLPFTNEMALQLPGQYRSTVIITENGRSQTVVNLLDGDKVTLLINGKPQPASPVHLAQLKQTLQLEHVVRLAPLLSDRSYALHPLPEVRYNTHVYVGVRVERAGQRDVKLYFDRASGLLVKTEHQLEVAGGKDVLQEAFYAGHRDYSGRVRPGAVVVLRDGKKVMEAEVVEARTVDRIDDREFSQP
ncbi:MAG: hypothetical protein U0797_03890 [Gemmataceae bacterium]